MKRGSPYGHIDPLFIFIFLIFLTFKTKAWLGFDPTDQTPLFLFISKISIGVWSNGSNPFCFFHSKRFGFGPNDQTHFFLLFFFLVMWPASHPLTKVIPLFLLVGLHFLLFGPNSKFLLNLYAFNEIHTIKTKIKKRWSIVFASTSDLKEGKLVEFPSF